MAIYSALFLTTLLMFYSSHYSPFYRAFRVQQQTLLSAEPTWAPADGSKWEDKDFDAEFKKLQEEAESRLDKKIEELLANVEKVGKRS